MSRDKLITQVTIKVNPNNEASVSFFRRIENRDRRLYPTIFSYLNAAVEMLEISADGSGDFPVLTKLDMERIGLTVLESLRVYEMKKKEEQMLP